MESHTALDLRKFIENAIRLNASDIHFQTDSQPLLRVNGDIRKTDFRPLTPDDMQQLFASLLDDKARQTLDENGAVDCCHIVPDLCRLRVSCVKCLEGYSLVTRLIPTSVPSLKDFNMPEVFERIAGERSGFIVVAGLTGNGKSTTIAAMIEHINSHFGRHVVTLEDPIEFMHQPKNCAFSHRELETHTQTFADGMRETFRQDPDVIVIGELRDPETMRAAMQAAETGHLVFATLHCRDVENIPERIIGSFPESEQAQVRSEIASVGLAFIAQQLIKRSDGEGRIGAYEVLILNDAARNLIRREQSYNLPSVMQTERRHDMVTMTDAVLELLQNGIIDEEHALAHAPHRQTIEDKIKGR